MLILLRAKWPIIPPHLGEWIHKITSASFCQPKRGSFKRTFFSPSGTGLCSLNVFGKHTWLQSDVLSAWQSSGSTGVTNRINLEDPSISLSHDSTLATWHAQSQNTETEAAKWDSFIISVYACDFPVVALFYWMIFVVAQINQGSTVWLFPIRLHQIRSNILKLQEALTFLSRTKMRSDWSLLRENLQIWARIYFCSFRVPLRLVRRSSTTHSCAATLQSSIRPWGSSSSTTRTGPSSGRGFSRSYGNAKICTTGGSCTEDCSKLQRSEIGFHRYWSSAEHQAHVIRKGYYSLLIQVDMRISWAPSSF